MKKNIFFIIAACSFLLTSCGLLEVKSEDKLPGDEFWIDGNAANVEGFLMSAYSNLRKATMAAVHFLLQVVICVAPLSRHIIMIMKVEG